MPFFDFEEDQGQQPSPEQTKQIINYLDEKLLEKFGHPFNNHVTHWGWGCPVLLYSIVSREGSVNRHFCTLFFLETLFPVMKMLLHDDPNQLKSRR